MGNEITIFREMVDYAIEVMRVQKFNDKVKIFRREMKSGGLAHESHLNLIRQSEKS